MFFFFKMNTAYDISKCDLISDVCSSDLISSDIAILKEKQKGSMLERLHTIISRKELLAMQELVQEIYIHDDIFEYIAKLVQATRNHELLVLGISARGTIALTNMAKATAYINCRDYVKIGRAQV